jgi:hypothetical protein
MTHNELAIVFTGFSALVFAIELIRTKATDLTAWAGFLLSIAVLIVLGVLDLSL